MLTIAEALRFAGPNRRTRSSARATAIHPKWPGGFSPVDSGPFRSAKILLPVTVLPLGDAPRTDPILRNPPLRDTVVCRPALRHKISRNS